MLIHLGLEVIFDILKQSDVMQVENVPMKPVCSLERKYRLGILYSVPYNFFAALKSELAPPPSRITKWNGSEFEEQIRIEKY